ncbi:MAG: hypothetical protein ACYTGP_08640 [Planctomycetota bacterium]|jgi:hypothetical protein
MDAADPTSSNASGARRRPRRRGRCVLRTLAPAGCLVIAGCHLVPADDVNTIMVDLAPQTAREIDEAALAETIRAETRVEEFEFAEELHTGQPRLPRVLAQLIRLVAGEEADPR